MDRLNATITVVSTFCAGVFGNIIARDFCEFTPKLCRRLIERAVRVLPNKELQERYSEEWRAHLAECTGVFRQYKHAATCIIGARRLRNATLSDPGFKKARFEFDGIGVVDLDPCTGITVMHFIVIISFKFATRLAQGKRPPNKFGYLWIFISTFCVSVFRCRKHGRVNNAQLKTLIKYGLRAIKERHNAVLHVNGKRIDFAKTLESAKNGIPASIT